ncbi:MED7 protein-domain-containing protein [Xylogone sp. PMI_703]|nr:MED7 protein-domain-containing protein [Xylogone sp. PMI_703]
MAEQQQPNALAAAFPNPPPFWQHFTPENLNRIAEIKNENGPTPQTRDLPPELRFLVPPEPPAEGIFNVFGDRFNINEELPSLEEQGIQQLYTSPSDTGGKHLDRALILKRIAKSLLLNFLELVGIMSINPEEYQEKVNDIRTLFINFHHLLNEYRPHQARESLILMMQDQLDRSKAEIDGIMKMKGRVEGLLDGLAQTKIVESSISQDSGSKDTETDPAKDIWDELEKEFG